MRGICSYMGWTHVPDMDSSNPSDDSPFAGPKAPAPSKVSVQMPTEDWLCKKLSKLKSLWLRDTPPVLQRPVPGDGPIPETCKVTVQVVQTVF